MVPDFLENGQLPNGIHECTIEELKKHFGYNNKRNSLINKLEKLIQLLNKVNSPAIYIDGSFTTSKKLPNDIDACWDESSGTDYNDEYELAPELFSRAYMEKHFNIDLFPAQIVEEGSGVLFLDFFQTDRDGNAKGILKINLR